MKQDFDYRAYQEDIQQKVHDIFMESICGSQVQEDECLYRKIQNILNCKEMETCHPYLYALDMDNISESDKNKINKIYELGEKRGFLSDKNEENNENNEVITNECDYEDGQLCGGPDDALTGQELQPQSPITQNTNTFTVLYSATKNGRGSMGEFYSVAPTIEGAKEECINSMTAGGYTDINIMAVDQNQFGVDSTITSIPQDVNLYDVYETDEEDEKQETEDTTNDTNTEKVIADTSDKKDDEDVETKDNGTSKEKETTNKEETEEDTTKDDKELEDEKGKEDNETDDDNDTEDKQEDKNLTPDEKGTLKEEYTKTFKDVLKKLNYNKSVQEMSLQEKTEFFKMMAEKWTKNDPSEFMNDKDQEKLNSIVVKNSIEDNQK